LALGGALLLAGCEEGPFLQTESFETKAGESEIYTGGGCMPVSKGSGMGAGSAPAPGGEPTGGYEYSYEGTGSGVRFVFKDGNGEVLEERNYAADFIKSKKRDEVVVMVGEKEMRFVHWGSQECEPIREPEEP
jgi:hypothetical protein